MLSALMSPGFGPEGRSSHRVQMEFPELRKRYWGRHFWAREYFCTTSGNITDDVILEYILSHEHTGASRELFSVSLISLQTYVFRRREALVDFIVHQLSQY